MKDLLTQYNNTFSTDSCISCFGFKRTTDTIPLYKAIYAKRIGFISKKQLLDASRNRVVRVKRAIKPKLNMV